MGPTVSNFKVDEVARHPETSVFIYQIKRGHVQGNQIVATHRCENFKYEYNTVLRHRGLSPQANYTDRAAAAGRPS